jgi:hypothetical protein
MTRRSAPKGAPAVADKRLARERSVDGADTRGTGTAPEHDAAVELLQRDLGAEVVEEVEHPREEERASALLPLPGELTETSYRSPRLTYERWKETGGAFFRMGDSVMWWLGDWYLHGVALFGEDLALQAAPSGYASETVRKAAFVCERIDSVRRRTDLPFGHHDAVASLAPSAQRELLAAAAPDPSDEHRRPQIAVKDLRRAARRVRDGATVTQALAPEPKPEPAGHAEPDVKQLAIGDAEVPICERCGRPWPEAQR